MQRFDVKAADILNRRYVDGFVPLMQFQAERARAIYRQALASAADRRSQGAATGPDHGRDLHDTARRDRDAREFRVLHQRIALTPLRKLWIAWRTWIAR
jgi:15-cis-phytoene synthase